MSTDKSFDYIIKPSGAESPVKIHVVDKTKVKGKKRREIIQKIFQAKQKELKGQETITITGLNEKDVSFKIGKGKKETIEIKEGPVEKIEVHLAVKEAPTQSRIAAFKASYQKLFFEYWAGNFVFGIWQVLVLPIWAIYDSVRTLEEETQKHFFEEISPSGPEGFIEALETTHNLLQDEIEDSKVLPWFKHGIDLGKQFAFVSKNPAVRKNFFSQLAGEIQKASTDNPVILPAGYYSQRGYNPALFSFYKDNDKIVVQKFSLACEDPAHTGKLVPLQEYRLSQDQFSTFFEQLSALQAPPQPIALSEKEQKKRAALPGAIEGQKIETAFIDPLEAILGTPTYQGEPVKPSDDPWKLIFIYLKSSDEFKEDKLTFMTRIVDHATSTVLKYFDRLTIDQQDLYLKVLDKRLGALEEKLRKKDPKLADSILPPIKAKIHRFAKQKDVERLKRRELAKSQALTQPLPSSPLRLNWKKGIEKPKAGMEKISEEKEIPGIASDAKSIKQLPDIFQQGRPVSEIKPLSQENADEVIKLYTSLHKKTEDLLNAKDYQQARVAATVILSSLPSIDTPNLWKNLSLEQMDKLSRLIEQTTGQLYEAKLRLGDSHLWPDELVHVFNGKAILVSLIRERLSQVKQTAFEAYKIIPNAGQKLGITGNHSQEDWDEVFEKKSVSELAQLLKNLGISFEEAQALVFHKYTLESTKICHLLENDPYLHFGEDPILDQKASALLEFYKHDREQRNAVLMNAFEDKGLLSSTEEMLQKDLASIFKAYEKPVPDDFLKQAKKEIDSSKANYLPHFLIELRRDEVWTDGLLNPKGTLYLGFPKNIKGTARALNWISTSFAKAQEGTKDASEIALRIREQQYVDCRKRLNQMGRLSLKIEDSMYDDEQPVVQIFSENFEEGASSESRDGFCLFPRQLPGKFKEFPVEDDPHLFRPVMGFMPEELAISRCGDPFMEGFKEIEKEDRSTLLSSSKIFQPQPPAALYLQSVESSAFSDLDPLDRFKLNSLTQAIPLPSSINVWQLIESSPYLFNNPIIQNRILYVLFSNHALRDHLLLQPDHFPSILKNLDVQIQNSLETGNLERAAFFSFLAQRIKQEAQGAKALWENIKNNDETTQQKLLQIEIKENTAINLEEENEVLKEHYASRSKEAETKISELQEVLNNVPSSTKDYTIETPQKTSSSLQKEMFEALGEFKREAGDLKTLSLFLLAEIEETDVSQMTSSQAGAMLNAWELLRNAQSDITLPNMRELLLIKMQSKILPSLADRMQKDGEFRKEVLNQWTHSGYPNWVPSPENPCKFTITDEASADIATCAISTKIARPQASDMQFPIPDEIANHPIYTELFGMERFRAEIHSNAENPSLQECTFTLNERNFVLLYDRKKKELSVVQIIKGQRYQYTQVTASQKTNFAKTVQHYGMWLNTDRQTQALLIPGKMQDFKKIEDLVKESFTIHLDKKGEVIHITDNQGFYVVQDSKHVVASQFPFVEDSDIVFLRHPDSNTLSRIRLIKEKMEFAIDPETGNLRPLDKEKGWKVWQSNTSQLVERFGPSYEHYMLPLFKGNEMELRLFPNAINPLRIKGTAETLLDFEKKAFWETTHPSLVVKIDAQGRMHGSHAAFLYLAYVAFSQGQIDKAAIFLKEAERADKISPEEVPVIQFIAAVLREQPHPTAKTVAFQLKAEMTLRQILRDYYHVGEFTAEKWEAHHKNIERVLSLYQEYKTAEINTEKNQQLKSANLLLTEAEIAEFERFRKESIQVLLDIPQMRPTSIAAGEITFKRPSSVQESPQFLNHLILLMEPPSPNATKDTLLAKGRIATPDTILRNFWTYWDLISKSQITSADLSTFLLPIPMAKESDPALVEAVDFARRLLFTFALYVESMQDVIDAKQKEFNALEKQLTKEENKGIVHQLGSAIESKHEELNYLKTKKNKINDLFPSIRFDVFSLKKDLSDEEIQLFESSGFALLNVYRKAKLLKGQKAAIALVEACTKPINDMLQGLEDPKESLRLPGANQIIHSELRLPSPKKEPVVSEQQLTMQEFQEKIDKANLSPEEKALYRDAFSRVQKSDQKQPVSRLLNILLKEGGLPMVAVHRYNALASAAQEKEKPAPAKPVFTETVIKLEAKKESKFSDLFTADLNVPSRPQLDRLVDVLNQNSRYRQAWIERYEKIFKATNVMDPALNVSAPKQTASSKDVAEFLLYAAANNKKAAINFQFTAPSIEFPALEKFKKDEGIKVDGFVELVKIEESRLKEEQKGQIDKSYKNAIEAFKTKREIPDTYKAMTDYENERFTLGLKDAADKKKSLIESKKGFVNASQVQNLQQNLRTDISHLRMQLDQTQTAIFDKFAPLAKEFGLGAMFQNRERYTPLELLNAILDLYEDGQLSKQIGDETQRKELLSALSQYLFSATEMQQKEKALAEAAKLQPLAQKRQKVQAQLENIQSQLSRLGTKESVKKEQLEKESSALKEVMSELEIEWKELSSSIEDKIKAGENAQRFSASYKDIVLKVLNDKINLFNKEKDKLIAQISKIKTESPEKQKLEAQKKELEERVQWLTERKNKIEKQTGTLFDQEQTLIYLTREYRQKIIFTPEQVEKIETILDDPNALEEFRMGLGKSSVIFPCVARILISRDYFPIVLFTEELIEQSRKDMDKKAYVFQFNRNSSITPEDLVEEYNTLLSVKRSGRYVMTTVERIAALENKIIELNKQLKTIWGEYHKNKSIEGKEVANEKLFQQMNKIMEQLFWLQKINALFDDPKTRIVADEVDEIFNISSEKNYSDGELQVINRLAFNAGERIFQAIFSDKRLAAFKEALMADKLSNFSKSQIQAFMKIAAEAIYDDKKFLESIVWQGAKPEKEEFASYLSDITIKQLPKGLPEWKEDESLATIGAFRHWMTKTIPTLCEKQDGKDYGFSPDGYTVVPRREQREKPNTKFGQEAELVGYHLLAYIRNTSETQKNPQFDAFLTSQLSLLQNQATKDPSSSWAKWLQHLNPSKNGDPQEILANFRKSENVSYRMEFVRFIMKESPRIQVYTSQIARNVQDTILGRKVAGASGTMARYALPQQFSYDRTKDARYSTGDTLLRLSLMGKGFQEEVGVFENLIDQMNTLTRDSECKAIINQGYATPGMFPQDVIKQFRENEKKLIAQKTMKPDERREYIFINPEEKKAYLWLPDQEKPQPFDKELDAKKISERALYYFSPADVRGTDFLIPYGYGALIVGPTTTPDEFDQAIWRLRSLGQGQDCKVFVEKTHAIRIKDEGNVLFKDLILDVEQRGIETTALQNYKAASSRPEALLRSEVKKALFAPLGNADRFSKASRLALENEIESNVGAFTAVEPLFIRSKAMNFRPDYIPSLMEDIIPHLEKKFDETSNSINDPKNNTGILTKLPTAPLDNELGGQRITQLQNSLTIAQYELTEQRKQLQTDKKIHHQSLQAQVSSNETGQKDAQAEVQEQQQQQQQEQQAVQQEQFKRSALDKEKLYMRGSASSYSVPQINALKNPIPLRHSDVYSIENFYQGCGIERTSLPIHVSQSINEWMKVCPPSGKRMNFLVMVKHGEGNEPSDWTATNITPLDYQYLIGTYVRAKDGLPYPVSILALPDSDVEPEILFSHHKGKPKSKNYDELLVAISKLAMGYTMYPESERKKLFEWFKKLNQNEQNNWVTILEQRNAPKQCSEMLQDWIKMKEYAPAKPSSKQ